MHELAEKRVIEIKILPLAKQKHCSEKLLVPKPLNKICSGKLTVKDRLTAQQPKVTEYAAANQIELLMMSSISFLSW